MRFQGLYNALSAKGWWIDSEIFLDWFVIRKTTENHIILFCLPPHTTHLCQPLDRSCFSPLKAAYNQHCQEFLSSNPGQVISWFNFTQIFTQAWTKAVTPANIVMGFRATGVYPLTLSRLNYGDKKCLILMYTVMKKF